MSEEEQEAIKETKKKIESTQKGLKEGRYYGEQFNLEREIKREQILLNLIDKYKRLAEANLKDSQEFQDNMCNHRCIKNNEVLELKEELKKKDKVINLMAFEITENTGSCPLDIYDWKNKKYDNCNDCNDTCRECFIEYFYNQTEEEDE